MLRAEHLTREHAGRPVLHDVSAAFDAGRLTAVIGPSGSGKTTLLHLLAGLDRPSRGRVLLDGLPLPDDDRARTRLRAERFGLVFQAFNLVPVLSAAENVALPLIIAGRRPTGVTEALAAVGLAGRGHCRPAELSGGEQQRVAVARALVTNPSVILADEPTGALDSASGAAVLELLREAAHGRRHTVVVVTHDAAVAAAADAVVALHDGRVLEPAR